MWFETVFPQNPLRVCAAPDALWTRSAAPPQTSAKFVVCKKQQKLRRKVHKEPHLSSSRLGSSTNSSEHGTLRGKESNERREGRSYSLQSDAQTKLSQTGVCIGVSLPFWRKRLCGFLAYSLRWRWSKHEQLLLLRVFTDLLLPVTYFLRVDYTWSSPPASCPVSERAHHPPRALRRLSRAWESVAVCQLCPAQSSVGTVSHQAQISVGSGRDRWIHGPLEPPPKTNISTQPPRNELSI